MIRANQINQKYKGWESRRGGATKLAREAAAAYATRHSCPDGRRSIEQLEGLTGRRFALPCESHRLGEAERGNANSSNCIIVSLLCT